MIQKQVQVEKQSKYKKEDYLFFRTDLKKQFNKFDISKFSEIIFLCIGSSRVIGDMIGPMVGEKLKNRLGNERFNKVKIYGDMKSNLNLKNANNITEKLKQIYDNPLIVTIDTALGKEEMINKIIISNGKIEIGKAIGSGIMIDSHINIKGIVGEHKIIPEKNMNVLKNAKIESVLYLSNIITKGIVDIIKINQNTSIN